MCSPEAAFATPMPWTAATSTEWFSSSPASVTSSIDAPNTPVFSKKNELSLFVERTKSYSRRYGTVKRAYGCLTWSRCTTTFRSAIDPLCLAQHRLPGFLIDSIVICVQLQSQRSALPFHSTAAFDPHHRFDVWHIQHWLRTWICFWPRALLLTWQSCSSRQ